MLVSTKFYSQSKILRGFGVAVRMSNFTQAEPFGCIINCGDVFENQYYLKLLVRNYILKKILHLDR
jgi:hypothetical protein